MSLKAFFAKIFAHIVVMQQQKWMIKPVETQKNLMDALIQQARFTQFGRDHLFSTIKSHADFVRQVPVRDYEDLRPYINQVVEGKPDILWKGKPLYFAKLRVQLPVQNTFPLRKNRCLIMWQAHATPFCFTYTKPTMPVLWMERLFFYREAPKWMRKTVLKPDVYRELPHIMFQNIYKKTDCQVGKPTAWKIGKPK